MIPSLHNEVTISDDKNISSQFEVKTDTVNTVDEQSNNSSNDPNIVEPSIEQPKRRVRSSASSGFFESDVYEDIFDSLNEEEFPVECKCGDQTVGSKHIVVCEKCGLRQHAECVNFDLTDPYRGCYLCPHCHVEEV